MNAADTNRHMERIYSSMAEEDIPWSREEPPTLLVELVKNGGIQPGRTLDIGCGFGNYSGYLAANGFEVTGVDVSSSAIMAARQKALESGIKVRFEVADMTADCGHIKGPYDFVNEWMVLHHILPPDREAYLNNIVQLLDIGGKYLSVSFSEENVGFGDPPTGKIRKSPMGPTIYCATLEELVTFFSSHLRIIDQKAAQIPGQKGRHIVNYLLMEKI